MFRWVAQWSDVLVLTVTPCVEDAVAGEAARVGMPYVNHRWLGGLLTNWRTISDRIQRLHELRALKQESQLDLLPPKERIAMESEPAKGTRFDVYLPALAGEEMPPSAGLATPHTQ